MICWHGVYKKTKTVWLRWARLTGELLLLPEAQRATQEKQRANAEANRANAEAKRANVAEQRAQVALKEGEQKKALETARQMLADGLDFALITKYTGISAEELATMKYNE